MRRGIGQAAVVVVVSMILISCTLVSATAKDWSLVARYSERISPTVMGVTEIRLGNSPLVEGIKSTAIGLGVSLSGLTGNVVPALVGGGVAALAANWGPIVPRVKTYTYFSPRYGGQSWLTRRAGGRHRH